MQEMSVEVDAYFVSKFKKPGPYSVWAGGSLGRREILPHSDVDIFLIQESDDHRSSKPVDFEGFDKVEIGYVTLKSLPELLNSSLVDANRIIDGRGLLGNSTTVVGQAILSASSTDRQLANIAAEYFYWHYFDFPQKSSTAGPNFKYSSGSSRATVLFNMSYRLGAGRFPVNGDLRPEIVNSLEYIEGEFDIRPPLRSIEIILTSKNVAASLFGSTDPRGRFASRASLYAIYEKFCHRIHSWGARGPRQFVELYLAARCEVESAVNATVVETLSRYLGRSRYGELLSLSKSDLLALCSGQTSDGLGEYPHAITAVSTWLLVIRNPSSSELCTVAENLLRRPLEETWGGLMAIICSEAATDQLLQSILIQLTEREKGAYLTKLITRNPSASSGTKEKARHLYLAREKIEQI